MAGFMNPNTAMGQFRLPTSTVELSISCTNLSDCDWLSKSDPVAFIFGKVKGGDWRELWRSEMLVNEHNPKWKSTFVHEYRFEENQPIKIEIFDWDSGDFDVKNKLKDQDLIGRIETNLASLVSAKQFNAVLRGKDNRAAGKCAVVTEEVTANKEVVKVQFAAKDLDKKDTFGKSDPFMVISRTTPAQNGQISTKPVFTTNVVKNSLKPSWDSFTISLKNLCNGDYERPIQFDVFDYDDNSDCDLIGSFTTTFSKLKSGMVEQTEFKCVNPKKAAKKKSYKDSGKVYLKYLEVKIEPSFVDYIQAGTLMNFSVAVDFTASNGPPSDPRSLHYLPSLQSTNQYTQAIQAVGEIIEVYDTDKQFPALGFGAQIPPHGQVSHEFFLNMAENPYCLGVQGILQAYRTALTAVSLYGPTNFQPVINHVAQFAKSYQNGQQYFVLLILTDGAITDFEETKSAIVAASELPMSIIIVGVGDADFSAMEGLDSDKGLLRSQMGTAVRDIVQFVEMRRCRYSDGSWDREGLAKEVLAEVPNQVVKWMTLRGIKPLKS